MTESPSAPFGSDVPASTPTTGWRQSAIILLVALLVAAAMLVASFTCPTLESGYLPVALLTLLLTSLALRRWRGASLDTQSAALLLFARLYAVMLAVICLFDAMDWSLLGERRDGETGFTIGLILAFFLCSRSLRRLFPKATDRAAILLGLIFLAAVLTVIVMHAFSGDIIPGLSTLCAGILILMLLPEAWRLSSQLSPGWRLALNIGAACTLMSSLADIYPESVSGQIWVWLLWCLACIAARRGTEPQTPGVAIIDRLLLGAGLFVFLLVGTALLPGVATDTVRVPAALLAALPLLHLLGNLKGKGSVLLCWLALLLAGYGVGSAALSTKRLPLSSLLLAQYLLPTILLSIALRHLWLRYHLGIRPLFISGKRVFPALSMQTLPRKLISAGTVLLLTTALLLPGWMLASNTSPTKMVASLHGTPLWPGLPFFVTLAMHDDYYYYDKVPWRWPASEKVNEIIETLRYDPLDKFSFYNPVSMREELGRYTPGKGEEATAKLNFGYHKDKQSGVCRIAAVFPRSPLEKAGIHRGDELLAINNAPVKPGKICSELGDKILLTVRTPTGQERDVAVACTAATPFTPFHRIIATASGPVGYLYLDGFNLNEYAGVSAEIMALHKSGIRNLVLDLRNNGGGNVFNEWELDAMLLGSRFAGVDVSRTIHNRKYRDMDRSDTLPQVTLSLGLTRLVVLTTAETCSASEALINDLKPYLWVRTVGAATCGKPMMMEVKTLGSMDNGSQLELVTAQLENMKGEGAYFNGIQPDCPVVDDGNHDLGYPHEALLQEALHLLETGRCLMQ